MILFSLTALRKGYNLKAVIRMNVEGMKKSLSHMPIFALIGIITAIWRASCTIPLATLSASPVSILYAVYLYLVPIINIGRLPKMIIKKK
ncbi:MAG TPA: hypothetical protein GX396_00715 [Tissierellia bacterium]|jgi:NhaC family Na+:H+ antiporter|nr:hypothetical protein [Tissierellia bacterium]